MSCNGLPNLDRFSKSDPMIVAYTKNLDGRWCELGKTETIWVC
eukprot:SAG11_NODE_27_length_23309_cov_10.579362_7_plen_43_part_00